jgi:hypothetical protein
MGKHVFVLTVVQGECEYPVAVVTDQQVAEQWRSEARTGTHNWIPLEEDDLDTAQGYGGFTTFKPKPKSKRNEPSPVTQDMERIQKNLEEIQRMQKRRSSWLFEPKAAKPPVEPTEGEHREQYEKYSPHKYRGYADGNTCYVCSAKRSVHPETLPQEQKQEEQPKPQVQQQQPKEEPKQQQAPQQRTPEEESAQADFDTEMGFAKNLLAGQVTIEQFPYYASYKSTIDAESKLLPAGGRVLFVGGGPIPLSSILFAQNGFTVDTLELNGEAKQVGEQVAKAVGAPVGKFMTGDARTFNGYAAYDGVIIALEAGPEAVSKSAVVKNIMANAKPGTVILARGTAGGGGDAFVDTAKSLPPGVRITNAISTFDGLSKTYAIEKTNG